MRKFSDLQFLFLGRFCHYSFINNWFVQLVLHKKFRKYSASTCAMKCKEIPYYGQNWSLHRRCPSMQWLSNAAMHYCVVRASVLDSEVSFIQRSLIDRFHCRNGLCEM